MPLREGDSLTLSLRPVIFSGDRYRPFKPMATLTRVLGPDPEKERDEMERILVVEVCRDLLRTIRARNSLQAALGEEHRVTGLIEFCEKVVEDGPEGLLARHPDDVRVVLAEGTKEDTRRLPRRVARKAAQKEGGQKEDRKGPHKKPRRKIRPK